MKYSKRHIILYLLGGMALLFVVAPVLNMFFASSFKDVFGVAREVEVQKSIFLTLWVSVAATIVCSVFAVPLAWLIAKKSFKLKTLLLGIINIPIVIPHSAAGIAVLGLVSRDTFFGKAAASFGMSFIDSPLGIGVAMAYVSLPFLIISAVNGFSEVPERLEQAAMNLGASRWQVFIKVSLPLAKNSVYSGLVLMFSRGISEFGAVIMLAYFPTITPILIYDRFVSYGLAYARPVAVIFVIICLSVFLTFYLLTNKRRKANG
jgi:molybdate/tungstate transport system permease protein